MGCCGGACGYDVGVPVKIEWDHGGCDAAMAVVAVMAS